MSVASESFLESTFIDQNNPTRQTAGPHWGSLELGLLGLAYHDARRPRHRWGIEVTTTTGSSSHVPGPVGRPPGGGRRPRPGWTAPMPRYQGPCL